MARDQRTNNSNLADQDRSDALARLAQIPPADSEERGLWLEAAEQHGFEETSGGEQITEYGPPTYFATADEVLKLMSEARKQGQRDVLAASPAARGGEIPEGWALVPEQATGAMWQAGRDADEHPTDSYSAVWAAMVAAAPSPSQGSDAGGL